MADSSGIIATDDPFGWCPECGRRDGILNIFKAHVAYCDAHRVRWDVGWNLLSSWRHEDEATWDRNAKRLCEYRDVDSHTATAQMLKAWMEGGA